MTREDIKIEFEKFLKFKYRIYRDIEGKEKLTVYEIDSDSLEDFATHVHNLIIKGKIEGMKEGKSYRPTVKGDTMFRERIAELEKEIEE